MDAKFSIALTYLVTALAATAICGTAVVDPLGPSLVLFAAGLIAIIGVPHGGLDHWIGRRFLQPIFGNTWSIIFLTAYLTLASAVALGWVFFPTVTIISFFLLSAWHFGREENAGASALAAISVGGAMIWSIAIFNSDEMTQILTATLDQTLVQSQPGTSALIVKMTGMIGLVLLPIGVLVRLKQCSHRGGSNHRGDQGFAINRVLDGAVMIVTILAGMFAPILVAFTIYFCFYHSLLGLRKLRIEENLSRKRFVFSIAPMSILALAMVVGVDVLAGGLSIAALGQSAWIRLTFVGLASIAVPHILLHEFGDAFSKQTARSGQRFPAEVIA